MRIPKQKKNLYFQCLKTVNEIKGNFAMTNCHRFSVIEQFMFRYKIASSLEICSFTFEMNKKISLKKYLIWSGLSWSEIFGNFGESQGGKIYSLFPGE
mgnify:CR=1 FL=1